jgi:signal recognition particle receptor subunit beta
VRLEEVPHVIQYNQRDRPDPVPITDLRARLNLHGVREFEAVANEGRGVMDTLHAIIEMVREDIQQKL